MVFGKFHKIDTKQATLLRRGGSHLADFSREELSAIQNQLENEKKLIQQFTVCAYDADDPQLRTLFEQIAARHRLHWEALAKLVDEE